MDASVAGDVDATFSKNVKSLNVFENSEFVASTSFTTCPGNPSKPTTSRFLSGDNRTALAPPSCFSNNENARGSVGRIEIIKKIPIKTCTVFEKRDTESTANMLDKTVTITKFGQLVSALRNSIMPLAVVRENRNPASATQLNTNIARVAPMSLSFMSVKNQ